MILSKPMKGLLEKEWRQNRGYFLATLLVITYAPVFKSILHLFQGAASIGQWEQELDYVLLAASVARPLAYTGLLEWLPVTGAVLLGIIILGEERRGSLIYLVSMPVSRRQIILAKFFPGTAAIILSMLVNGLFLVSLDLVHPMAYNSIDVLNWVLLTGATCVCCFTMALMVSTFTSGILAAGVVWYFLSFLPGIGTGIIEGIGARYFAVAESVSIKLYKLGSYLNLSDYITHSSRHITSVKHYSNWLTISIGANSGLGPDYVLESSLLFLGVLSFLVLAVVIFERVSLQTGGLVFASSTARKTGITIVALFISYLLVFPRSKTLLMFIFYFILLTGFIYISCEYLQRFLHYGWQLSGKKK